MRNVFVLRFPAPKFKQLCTPPNLTTDIAHLLPPNYLNPTMHKAYPEPEPSPPENNSPSPTAPSIKSAIASTVYLVFAVAELSLQLSLLAVATAINLIPFQQQPVANTMQLSTSATDQSSDPLIHPMDDGTALSHSTAEYAPSPAPSPSTPVQPLLESHIFRPHYLSIRQFLRLFPLTEPMDTEWFATEVIRSEDINLYDEHGEYETGLHLEDLTQADLDMDDDEVAVVTQSVASLADTFGNTSSVILAPSPVSTHSASIVTVSSPVPILCDNCRTNYNPFDDAYPETATISNIGWYCSPVSESRAWFVVPVGRNIGVFDNWLVFSRYLFTILTHS